ncbi:MAG: hypothetical protein ACYCZ0_03580 [Minisyncoccota bacterium]
MKTILIIAGVAVAVLAGGVWLSNSLQSNDPDIVSRSGIHWHPSITIYVKGEKVEIPANIGIGPEHAGMPGYDPMMKMAASHTHDASGTIHFEFMDGPVRKADTTLGQFFTMWGKDMRAFGSNMRMTVNGKENTEYESYMMRDGDKIELRYD